MTSIVELKNVTKKYNNNTVIDDLSLSVEKGEIFGFLGPNGAGKSTTINIMLGLTKASSGDVLVNCEKSEIGVCPQDIILWENLTCYENLYTMGKMYDIKTSTLKKRISTTLDKLFLNDKKNVKITELSGGMKRRMNIAMATIHSPSLLILDEPSEGLDPQSRRILWDYITLQKDNGNTIILTTHLMDEADILSDRVAIIDNGKLLKLDTPLNLKSTIGDGDIVTINVENNQKEVFDSLNKLQYVLNIKMDGDSIIFKILNATQKLPEIIHIIEDNDSKLVDINIRQNTLEDVFIELTGRQLRE